MASEDLHIAHDQSIIDVTRVNSARVVSIPDQIPTSKRPGGFDAGSGSDSSFFTIRLANTAEGRNSATMLIQKMYGSSGYGVEHHVEHDINKVTLLAEMSDSIKGTITMNMDSPAGLLAEAVFPEEIAARRGPNVKLCELTKLAFDPMHKSKDVLAALFHIIYIYSRKFHNCTHMIIEVNPRHKRFYERMLGFKTICDVRMNARVNAPAVLLELDLTYADDQVRLVGGTFDKAARSDSLYYYFFSDVEEQGITERLKKLE